jgi:hypothetical protein
MNKDQNPDPGTGVPEDAESGDDDTLDLTEAMTVTPPKDAALRRDGDGSDQTVDLANATTRMGGDDAESIPNPAPKSDAAASPEAEDDEEEVIDLAAASAPSSDDEEDEEFGRPQATVAISPQELAGLGVSRDEADSADESAADFLDSDDFDDSDETIDLADSTTLINGENDIDSIPASEGAADDEDDDEEVIDLASASSASPAASADEEDEEFGGPQATVAISPEELTGLGVSRAEADPAGDATAELAGDDTLREQPTDLNTEEILDTPAPVEADEEPDEDDDDRFLDIDTGTLVAMGREFELNNGNAADATLALGGSSEDEDDDVIDLGALGSPAQDSSETDADRDAETVIAPPLGEEEPISTGEPISLSEDDLAAADPVDRDAATVFMPTGPPTRTVAAGLQNRLEDEESLDRDADTVYMPAGVDDETEIPGLGPDSVAEDFETFRLPPEGGEEDEASGKGDGPPENGSGEWESNLAGGIPAGGFSDFDRPADEEEEAVDPDAETMIFSRWADGDEEETDGANLTALELLDSISGLPDPGDEGGLEDGELEALEDDSVIPGGMDELYGLIGASRASESDFGPDFGPDFGTDSGAESTAAEPKAEESGERPSSESGTESPEETESAEKKLAENADPAERTGGQSAVALPEARRRGDSGEERCFSITPDQMQTILERVVDKIFSEKIEKILTDVIERAVADEMRKLESYFFEELDDRGGQ